MAFMPAADEPQFARGDEVSHLVQFRTGWENEHLATYLLARISFVARPVTVADDVGTDLYCTLFEIVSVSGRECAQPRNSVAVQIKSTPEAFEITKKKDYFLNLELPYYIGVLDRGQQTLALHSARYLPHLLSWQGWPATLKLKPVESLSVAGYHEPADDGFVLLCPLVATLRMDDDRDERNRCFGALHTDAAATLRSIASKLNHEYVFETDWGIQIIAGQTSARHYEANFFKRLAEVFYNLEWLMANARDLTVVEKRITAFLALYSRLCEDVEAPLYLANVVDRLTKERRLTNESAEPANGVE